jgi:hypothetical protein
MPSKHWQNETRGRGWLVAAVAIVAVVWLGALPRVGSTSRVHRYIERNESLGIDPSAKFYTELPLMPATIDRVDAARRRDAPAFW